MNWKTFRSAGHLPTLVSAFLYFDYSFMVWTLLGVLGSQIAAPESLNLSDQQKYFMVAVPILSGACLRILCGFLVDRLGAKNTGLLAQLAVIAGLLGAWGFGLRNYPALIAMGIVLGVAGASFAVALPQVGRWYPPSMQGLVLGLAGAGNIGVVIDSLIGPRLAARYGWQAVFGFALIPAVVVFLIYLFAARDAAVRITPKRWADYARLFRDKDTHWFCLYYTVSFGGFVGLGSSFIFYFKDRFGLSSIHAGDLAALCTAIGALSRPLGGALADRIGGIRSLYIFYTLSGLLLLLAGSVGHLALNVFLFVMICGSFGMANGSVFQLLPQRYGNDLGLMTGLVGCGGGLGGFLLANLMGQSRQHFGSFLPGLLVFAGLCFCALFGLGIVKKRWRTTWGAMANARI